MEKDDTDYRLFRLRNGDTAGNVIQQQRQGLLNTWRKAQEETPLDLGIEPAYSPGFAAGRLLADFYRMAKPGGPIDFKNRFPARSLQEAETLGRVGNFAYYAIGDGIIPRGLLDVGAAGYALLHLGGKKLSDITFPKLIDKSAYAVRDKALSLPDEPQ